MSDTRRLRPASQVLAPLSKKVFRRLTHCYKGTLMARIAWIVRQGKRGDFDGPELARDYRSQGSGERTKIGDVLALPDGSGPWRVVDWMLADRYESTRTSSRAFWRLGQPSRLPIRAGQRLSLQAPG